MMTFMRAHIRRNDARFHNTHTNQSEKKWNQSLHFYTQTNPHQVDFFLPSSENQTYFVETISMFSIAEK
jgi:hypothetical protein